MIKEVAEKKELVAKGELKDLKGLVVADEDVKDLDPELPEGVPDDILTAGAGGGY